MNADKRFDRRKIYIVLLLAMMVLVIFAFPLAQANVYRAGTADGLQQMEPAKQEQSDDGSMKYTFVFDKLTPTTRNLLFYTNHQEVYVYMNNVLIYSDTKADSMFGHTTGAVWNQVEMPERSGMVQVVITPVYASNLQKNCTFYLGDAESILDMILRSSIPAMIMCIGIIGIGICILCFWAFSRMSNRLLDDVLYLGLLVCFMGVRSLGETQGFIYLAKNRVASSYMAYSCLMVIGVLFVMFVYRFMHLQDRLLHQILVGYGIAETILCQLLQFFHIRDMKQTVILTHIMIVASVAYMMYGIGVNLYRHCYVRRTVVNMLGFSVIAITMCIDMFSYYDNRVNANQAGKFGILIYILMVGVETYRETRQFIDEEKHLQRYREMATKDMLTDCYNRNAYDAQVEHVKDVKKAQVVAFDLNDLKYCNDNFGHQCGDKYLCDSASIIRSVYGRYGSVYRIGGDEFCVITQGLSMKRLKELKVRLAQAQREYNQRKPEVEIIIACGYAAYDEQRDQSVEDIRKRADEQMYENKKELKAKIDRTGRVL